MQFVIIDLSTNYCTKGEFFLACLDNPKTCFAEIKAYMSGIYTYPMLNLRFGIKTVTWTVLFSCTELSKHCHMNVRFAMN